jgi:hypothetical protein
MRRSELKNLLKEMTPLATPLQAMVLDYAPSNFLWIATPYHIRYAWFNDYDAIFDEQGILILDKLEWMSHPLVPGTDETENECHHAWSSTMVRIDNVIFAYCSMTHQFWFSNLEQTLPTWQAIDLPSTEPFPGHPSCVAVESQIYFFCDKQPVQIYDPIRKYWHSGKNINPTQCASAIRVLSKKIYLVGGEERRGKETHWGVADDKVIEYDVLKDRFSNIGKLQIPRSKPSIALFEDKLLVLAGYGNDEISDDGRGHSCECLNSYEVYQGKMDLWFLPQEWKHVLAESHWSLSSEIMIDEDRHIIYTFVNGACFAHDAEMVRLKAQPVPSRSSKCTVWNVII